jgi:hypothetical protein
VPLGTRFGFQLDGLVAGSDSPSQSSLAAIGAGAHLFWRDPAVGLLGAYGNYVHSNAFGSSNMGSGAGEGALYLDRIRLDALVGVQGGTGNPAWLFNVAQLSYYPIDNLRGWVGQRYVFGRTALSLGAEYGIATGSGTMPALFVTGTRLEDGTAAFLAGMRLYLGQRDKPLISRQREDDPPNWLASAAGDGMPGNPGPPPICNCSQGVCITTSGKPCSCSRPTNSNFSCFSGN